MRIETIIPEIGEKPFLEFGFGTDWAVENGPRAILSTLASGDMKLGIPETAQARLQLLASLRIEPSRLLSLHLTHSRRVIVLGQGEEESFSVQRAAGADGIVTIGKNAVPALTVADCMPIWLFDREYEAFGVLHSGWRGTGILREGVLGMASRFGSRPKDIAAILGPCIGACCYAVPEERARGFMAEFGESSTHIVPREKGEPSFHLDLRAANISLAARLGIGRLLDLRLCTSCSPSLGSYRRQGAQAFKRMLALCGYF